MQNRHIFTCFHMKYFITLASPVVLLAACVPAGDGDNEAIKIGVIAPLTGDAASFGSDISNSVNEKAEELNAAGGIDGRPVEIILEDGRCTGAAAASAAQKLISIDKVAAIVGGVCSGESLAIAPIAEAAKIVQLSPTSSSPDVTNAGDFVFRNYPSDALKTKAMSAYFKENGFTKVAVISENTDFAVGFRDSLEKDLGEGVYVFDEIVEPGTKDFRTLMTRLKKVEFDVFVANGQTPPTVAAMIQQMREQGISGLAISHDVADTIDLVNLAGEAAEGLQVINVPSMSSESEFGSRFIAKYGNPQSGLIYAALAYDALGVLAQAIAGVGTDGTAVRDYLYGLDEYQGAAAAFSFDKNGDVVGIPYALKEVQNGQFVTITDIVVN